MPTTPAVAEAIPTITGSPQIDSALRSAILLASGSLSAVAWTWLSAHGFEDENFKLLISGAIGAMLTGLAAMAWGMIAARNAKASVILQAVTAEAVTVAAVKKAVEVQAPITKAIAPAAQRAIIANAKIDVAAVEEQKTDALNNAELERVKP